MRNIVVAIVIAVFGLGTMAKAISLDAVYKGKGKKSVSLKVGNDYFFYLNVSDKVMSVYSDLKSLEKTVGEETCKDKEMKKAVNSGTRFVFTYIFKDGYEVVNVDSCPKGYLCKFAGSVSPSFFTKKVNIILIYKK